MKCLIMCFPALENPFWKEEDFPFDLPVPKDTLLKLEVNGEIINFIVVRCTWFNKEQKWAIETAIGVYQEFEIEDLVKKLKADPSWERKNFGILKTTNLKF